MFNLNDDKTFFRLLVLLAAAKLHATHMIDAVGYAKMVFDLACKKEAKE